MKSEEFDSSEIQSLIGYSFKNPGLLIQAFTRKSYSAEHPKSQNNEVLEFYGDVALNLYVSRSMCEKFGTIKDGQFVSQQTEGELSEIRSWNVNKKKLSNCIKVFELEKYLFLGNADIDNHVLESESVKEDLFEAIVGAVAIDSNWKFDDIKDVCQKLFSVSDFEENYIALLEEECIKRGLPVPKFHDDGEWNRIKWELKLQSSDSLINMHNTSNQNYFHLLNGQQIMYGGNLLSSMLDVPQTVSKVPVEEKFSVRIPGFKIEVSEYGPSKIVAKLAAAKKCYEWILRRDEIIKSIAEIDENLAANQLNELAQKKIIQNPEYSFSESHDENGNPVWKCSCKLAEEWDSFVARSESKKTAKQQAAAAALHYLISEVVTINKKEEK